MVENSIRPFVDDSEKAFLAFVTTGFVATQVFSYFGAEALLYAGAVLAGSIYVFRRPGEGIWVTFFLLAIACLLYPITVSELGEPDVGSFRPYNFAIASLAGAMVLSTWRRRLPAIRHRKQPGAVTWALALAGVFSVATIYGDLSPFRAEALYALQQCSTWISFFLFLWMGYRLALSPADVRQPLERFHLVALIYSLVFLAKFVYLNYSVDLAAATEFAYAQRIGLLFVGCSLALAVANRLAPENASTTKGDWLSALILLPAVVLSGSRSVTGAVILTIFFLAVTWRTRSLLRLSPLLLAMLLIGVVILRSHYQVVEEYVINKFLITPDQDVSFGGRVAEMEAVTEAVQRSPLLGSGTLATYTFFDPFFGWRESSFVDNGVGYLLLKTGLLGTSIFALFAVAWLRLLSRLRNLIRGDALAPMVILLFYLCFLPFGAAFFDIRYSWLVGIACGYSLYLNKTYSEETSLWVTEIGANGDRSCRSHA